MTSLLSIEIPRLESGAEPLLLSSHSPPPSVNLAAPVRVLPRGLALQRQAFLSARLLQSARRHADPHAANDSDDDLDAAGGLGAGAEDKVPESQRRQATRQRRFVRLSEEDLLVDWYDVLRLPQGDGSSEEQIRTAYRVRCLETHPDKQKNRSDEAFKQVQRAFDILGDTDTRLAYDSSRPFDDSIPAEKVQEEDYYAAFGPVFERNKKWSSESGLPSLGDDRTSLREVNLFYDRWSQFQSWRDFSHLVELEEIDDSMCREEKRYYQRENERQLSHLRREEQKRMRALVQRARNNDPRLRRKREAEEAARLRGIAEREAVRRQAREEEERRRAETAARERAEREAAQRRIVEAKGAVREAQKRVTAFLSDTGLLDLTPANKLLSHAVRKPNVEWLFSKIQLPEEASAVAEEVTSGETARVACPQSKGQGHEATDTSEGFEVDAVRRFNTLLLSKEQQVGETRYGEPIKKNVAPVHEPKPAKADKRTVEWDEEDLVRLQKATAKFPPGTVDRWMKIASMLRGKFTEEAAMAKVNELTGALHGSSSSNNNSSSGATTAGNTEKAVEDWTVKQQKQLEQGLRELKDYKEKDKFQKLAAMVEGKNAKECFERIMNAFGSTYQSPPPLSSPSGDVQSMVLQMGLQYGQNVLQEGEKGLMRHMPLISSINRYFRVDNQYVKRKLGILLFPFTRHFHRMERIPTESEEQMTFASGGHPSPTSISGQTHPVRSVLPLNDVFACDLYLPLMGAVTYVILSAVLYGMRQNSLTVEYLLSSASSLVFWLAIEVCLLKAASYVFRVNPEMSILDVTALCGYICIPVSLIVLLREILQLESDMMYVGFMVLYVVLSNGCFLWKSIRLMYKREERLPPQAKILAFSAFCLQAPFAFWFSIKPFQ